MKSTDDCIRIAAAGGGLDLTTGAKSTDDLIRIASAASARGAPIWVPGSKSTDDLIRIAAAGKGCVMVRFD
ncbi:hypothetical protein QA644_10765 [Rhizobium sp. CC1099]|uniref:hypothetical protein n=1 Tax=Rhizobium sp. CC1099 TaxID=3039160 RepID=UPI0024B0884B|nr:hypothetical protein [Rhizobium sp. CC1099]WFU89477.1 hypothetical protein QA644_10765 [Rhizobium sp. CC1099]